jgi:hypothetical protein
MCIHRSPMLTVCPSSRLCLTLRNSWMLCDETSVFKTCHQAGRPPLVGCPWLLSSVCRPSLQGPAGRTSVKNVNQVVLCSLWWEGGGGRLFVWSRRLACIRRWNVVAKAVLRHDSIYLCTHRIISHLVKSRFRWQDCAKRSAEGSILMTVVLWLVGQCLLAGQHRDVLKTCSLWITSLLSPWRTWKNVDSRHGSFSYSFISYIYVFYRQARWNLTGNCCSWIVWENLRAFVTILPVRTNFVKR